MKSPKDALLMADDSDHELEVSQEDERDFFLLNVVCFSCPYLPNCGKGAEYDPVTCVWFRDYLADSLKTWREDYEYNDDE